MHKISYKSFYLVSNYFVGRICFKSIINFWTFRCFNNIIYKLFEYHFLKNFIYTFDLIISENKNIFFVNLKNINIEF